MAARRALALILALSLIGPVGSAAAQGPGDEITRDTPYVPGEVVVAMAAGKTLPTYAAEAASLGRGIGAAVRAVARDGTAVLKGDPKADVLALAARLASQPGVRFAEPNYIYWIPEPAASIDGFKANTSYVLRRPAEGMQTGGKDFIAIEIGALQAMKSKRGSTITATYPNDPYLWWNGGWSAVGADIVWPNTTASAGVCVVDTGVDYLHTDLSGYVVNGYDYVNADTIPMDDNGHGTHVAGIIVAKKNNRQGMAGVSTGKVVAMKALNAQGWGTSFDIAQAINACANRIDIRIINLSLGSDFPSTMIENAVGYSVNTKGKLVVAAAGNEGTSDPSYPAYYATYGAYANKVLAVGASGVWFEDPPGNWWVDYWCMADYSNYGDWISVVAPGTEIYSTLPWDKPFYLNYFEGFNTRYDYLSGTSMATPFVAASAARRWGYKPTETNAQIGADVIGSGWEIYTGDGCWPSTMSGIHQVNVADLLDRGGMYGAAYDASNGLPLNGAQIQAYQTVGTTTTLRGTGVITAYTYKEDPWETDPTRVYTWYTAWTDIINLPAGVGFRAKVSKSGYTATPQLAFQDAWWFGEIFGGAWEFGGRTGVPPTSSNFDLVVHWWDWWYDDLNNPDVWDLDVNVWLPYAPNPLDPGQPAPFIVGLEGDDFGYLEGEPIGTLNGFPFAVFKRDGGWTDWVPVEDITIRSRLAHAPLAANATLPYYPGEYVIMVTDWGQEIDHDNDSGTPTIPLMGVYSEPSLYIWKDGVIKRFVSMGPQAPGDPCNAHWWKAAQISTSTITGPVAYTPINACGDVPGIEPYYALDAGGLLGIYDK